MSKGLPILLSHELPVVPPSFAGAPSCPVGAIQLITVLVTMRCTRQMAWSVMKDPVAWVLILALMIVSVAAAAPGGAREQPVSVYFQGDLIAFLDQQPVVAGGQTLVPVRGVFEAMGAQVKWESDARMVTVTWRGNQAAVFIGNRLAWVNGQKQTLDVAPRVIGDRTMVSLRFLVESAGMKVGWYERYQAIVIGERPPLPVLAPADNPHVVMPCTIRVAIRPVPIGAPEPLENGAYEVREVELAEYLLRVVAHEFGDFTEDNGVSHSYTTEPLKAGAMAALMYAWTHAWNPFRPDYDLDNSKRFQVYIPDKPYEQKHVEAVRAIWGTFMVRQGSREVFAPQYGSG